MVSSPGTPILRRTAGPLGATTALLAALLCACSGGGGGGNSGSGGGGSSGSGGGATQAGGTAGAAGSGAASGTGGSTGGSGATGGSASGGTGGTAGSGGSGFVGPYPPGPYGYDVGSTIANYAFTGYAAPKDAMVGVGTVNLGAFYNPSGQGMYPAGSPYGAGAPMPKALFIHAAAVWSGPDNLQAKQVTPPALAMYGGCLAALDVLIYGPVPNQTATLADAQSWSTKHNISYPVVIDPANQLAPIFEMQAFPTDILLDTRTMTIVDVQTGVPDSSYFAANVGPICP
jgi:hypothetical protein